MTSPGPTVSASRKPAGAAAASLAHQRQRGEGSDPVGVSSRTKPTQASPTNRVPGLKTATHRAAGSAPGRATSP